MALQSSRSTSSVIRAIRQSDLTIYDCLDSRPDLYLTTKELQAVLDKSLRGLDLNYPLRTRSKVLKSRVCEVLGYTVPKSFKKSKPRFPGQDFDTYIQKANNLQIWNEEVSPTRRYVLIRVDDKQVVTAVKVVSGEALALLDTTGTLTQKYQAKSAAPIVGSVLVSRNDTDPVESAIAGGAKILPLADLFRSLSGLVGKSFNDPGVDQERNRGSLVHQMVCALFPAKSYHDSGQFPDVPDQLLEVKLQTSPTIDLGLISPDSTEHLADQPAYRHCDVRYAVFYGSIENGSVRIDHVVLTTGADFFTFFRRFEGKVVNRKIQIPLPRGFFE
ncbi:MAG: restriction endonuclease [Phycisphaerae bacterium]|nr:restriction endonuclease [Phycisphaerae bacterium]